MTYITQLAKQVYKGATGAFLALFFYSIIAWFLPRHVIDLTVVVPQESYRVGGEIITFNTFERFATADSRYDNVLVCRNGVERRYLLYTVFASTEPAPQAVSKQSYQIPAFVEPEDKCYLVIDARHEIEILPFLHRTYTSHFESNAFAIKE